MGKSHTRDEQNVEVTWEKTGHTFDWSTRYQQSELRAVNSFHLGYENPSIDAREGSETEIIAVCSEIITKRKNTPCGQNVDF